MVIIVVFDHNADSLALDGIESVSERVVFSSEARLNRRPCLQVFIW